VRTTFILSRRARSPRAVIRTRRAAVTIAIATAAALVIPASAVSTALASTTSAGSITLSGALPRTSAPVSILAEVEIGSDYGAHHIPRKLEDIPVTSGSAPAGSSTFSLVLPRSQTLLRSARQGHGFAEVSVIVRSGSSVTQQFLPVPVLATAASGDRQVATELQERAAAMHAFPAMRVSAKSIPARAYLSPSDIIPCGWEAYGNEYEGVTRIGEVHVADLTGVTEGFEYQNSADSTVTLGISETAGSGFYGDGTVSITNSIGTDSGFTAGQGTRRYVQSHMYYQEYTSDGNAACPTPANYRIQAVQDAGDSFLENSASEPSASPYGGCSPGEDPYGNDTLQAETGYFDTDKGTAETISDAQKWLGFTFGSTSGFSSNLYDKYANKTSGDQYVCGTYYMPDVPTVYNNTW
jgi:hypothetical protein